VIGKDGKGVYQEDPKDESPIAFQMTEQDTGTIFKLAE
jgi:hypothetical protein